MTTDQAQPWTAVKLGPDNRPSSGTVIARGPTAESVQAHWIPGKVVICWTEPHKQIRRLSTESLGRVRRKRLWRRLVSNHPLIAAQLYEQELAARPSHYDAINACSTDTAWRPNT